MRTDKSHSSIQETAQAIARLIQAFSQTRTSYVAQASHFLIQSIIKSLIMSTN
ncbi:hypothetical protein [Calothrix sp. PCC 6303]|uniref:hypothetical protein n=1 Tax=Calothrix sp. PCC 6303 TaxID=1170562 RepID=UPI0003129750|nr:hypothetical protein [Calothrix sp. PCC 6303]